MLDHMILTVSDVERSLAFYETALKPLNIKFFLPTRAKVIILICGDLVMARGRSSGSSKETRSSVHSLGVSGRKQ
jgi:hypothetical protein